MRLTPKEIANLIKATGEFVGNHSAELRLFGSRTDERSKGGDIDLLLLVHNAAVSHQLQAQKHCILARMKELLGDQKIDLKIAQVREIDSEPFLQVIYPQSQVLNIWP